MNITTRRCFLAFLVAAIASLAGCSQMGAHPFRWSPSEPPTAQADAAAAGPTCTVFIYADGQQPQQVRIPLASGTVVQEALVKSGAVKRFRRMKVVLVRTSPETQRPHKLDVTYRGSKRGVAEETNYALHNGDRLLVKEDTTTALDELIDSALSPLGTTLHQRR